MRLVSTTVFFSALMAPSLATAPASAQCDAPNPHYKFTDVSHSKRLSNLRSDYMEGPATITYSRQKTASVNASMTASVEAEAGIVFAKASTSLGVTVGAEWSKSGTWSYEKKVPRGETARLVMWHASRRFLVTKYRLIEGCEYQRVYRSRVDAPLKSNINIWGLQHL